MYILIEFVLVYGLNKKETLKFIYHFRSKVDFQTERFKVLAVHSVPSKRANMNDPLGIGRGKKFYLGRSFPHGADEAVRKKRGVTRVSRHLGTGFEQVGRVPPMTETFQEKQIIVRWIDREKMKATVLISNLKDPLKMANIHANSKYANHVLRKFVGFYDIIMVAEIFIRFANVWLILFIANLLEKKILKSRKLSVSSLLAFINGDRLKVEQFFKDTLDHMGPFGMKNDRIEIRNLLIDGQNYYRHEKCSAIFDPFVKLLRIKFDKIQILNISGEFQLNFHDSIAPLKSLLDCRRGKFRIDCRNIDLFLVLKVDQETIKKVDLSFENCDFLVKISDTGLGFLVEKIAAKLIEMNKMNILNNFARLMEKWVLENGLNLSCL
uniref:Uncharacterized protein n=1 Tax=Romanomermis culicivorax TaxID=13658 RepID=A0A915I8C4_ROMCU